MLLQIFFDTVEIVVLVLTELDVHLILSTKLLNCEVMQLHNLLPVKEILEILIFVRNFCDEEFHRVSFGETSELFDFVVFQLLVENARTEQNFYCIRRLRD